MAATPLVPPTGTPPPTRQLLGATLEPSPGAGPTATATSILLNEALPAWTVMVYNSADNDAWRYAWDSLNAMEAAGASGQVQVVAAVDWPTANDMTTSLPARYVIRGNNDPNVITSEEAVGADETNFGDPLILADFVSWAMTTYPANQYALVLEGYGAGWRGCCLDMDPATGEPSDHLSLDEITAALESSLSEPMAPAKLDLIAFSGSMMGQLDVFQAVSPYAEYAVASAAPVPAGGWNYQTLLGALYANPWQDAREVASLMTTDYVAFNRDLVGNEFVAMTAVDLARIPDLVTTVETLALALGAGEPGSSGAAADARRTAQRYGAVLAGATEEVTAVDLGHAAQILAGQSPAADVAVSARAVHLAAQEATVAQDAGNGLPFASGMSIYWPVTQTLANVNYAETGMLPEWAAYLEKFASQTAAMEPPLITVTADSETAVNQTAPILLETEVFGRQLNATQVLVTQPDEESGARLTEIVTVPPPLMAGGEDAFSAYGWPDGRHAATLPWDTMTDYLYDANGESSAVLSRQVDQSSSGSLVGISGELKPAGSNETLAVVLEFPALNPVPAHIWDMVDGSPGPPFVHELPASAGDQFTPGLYVQSANGALEPVAGQPLLFDSTPTIYRSTRGLENGRYAVGPSATVLGGNRRSETIDVIVNQSGALAGYRVLADSQLGMEFPYPQGWTEPKSEAGTVRTTDLAQDTTLQVHVVDAWSGDAPALLADTLATLGGVTTLFEDSAVIGSEDMALTGARVAYGYPGADGHLRTGILTAFVNEERGYIIDLDGLQSEEASLMEIANAIATGWRFLSANDAPLRGWGNAVLGGYDVTYPPDMAFEDVNGWYRFVSGERFIAVRVQPATRESEDALAALLAAAGEGVAGFQVAGTGPLYLGGNLWQKGDFTYQNAAETTIGGTILTRQDGEQEIALWSEWPMGEGTPHDQATALAVAATMHANADAKPGN